MARRYDGQSASTPQAASATRRVDHSTARAFAAALSALAISSLVVTTSSNVLNSEGTIASSHIEAGTISIDDDDEGRSLIELTNMAPGRPEEQCIQVIYEGTIVPASSRSCWPSPLPVSKKLRGESVRPVPIRTSTPPPTSTRTVGCRSFGGVSWPLRHNRA